MTSQDSASSKPPSALKKRDPPDFTTPQRFVTLIAEDQKFVIHKALITYHSPFFDRAFNGPFLEGQTQMMELSDVTSPILGSFVHWLYTKKFHPVSSDLTMVEAVHLWMLGGRFLIPGLQNDAMDQIHKIGWNDADINEIKECVKQAYSVEQETMLQQLTIFKLARIKKRADVIDALDEFPAKLVVKLARTLMNGTYDDYWSGKKPASDWYVKVDASKD